MGRVVYVHGMLLGEMSHEGRSVRLLLESMYITDNQIL